MVVICHLMWRKINELVIIWNGILRRHLQKSINQCIELYKIGIYDNNNLHLDTTPNTEW